MALFRGILYSNVMEMETAVNVVIPEYGRVNKTVLLLHGMTANGDSWIRYSNAERYARAKGLVLVMPEVQHSYYVDMAYGIPYFTYVCDELPKLVSGLFRLPEGRERWCAAGLSMGGYGALKCALSRPERFSAAACLSSRFFLERRMGDKNNDPRALAEMRGILGMDCRENERNSIAALAEKTAKLRAEQRPRIFLACGQSDSLYSETEEAGRLLSGLGYDVTERSWAGSHNWDFWDEGIKEGLEFLAE